MTKAADLTKGLRRFTQNRLARIDRSQSKGGMGVIGLTLGMGAISAKTKVGYFETPANPNMGLVDIRMVEVTDAPIQPDQIPPDQESGSVTAPAHACKHPLPGSGWGLRHAQMPRCDRCSEYPKLLP
jgi:hypothetical protein